MVAARNALSLIKIEYDPLPAVFDPEEAMAGSAPTLHEYAANNIVKHIPIRKGDVEKGFAEADLVVTEDYQTQPVEHAYLEPEAGLAYVDHDDVVTVVSPSQNITHHRHMLAKILGLPIQMVRFIMSPVGGGFGGKEDMIYQGMLAVRDDEGAPTRPAGVHKGGVDRFDREAASGPNLVQNGSYQRRTDYRDFVFDGVRRRCIRHVHGGRYAQSGDIGLRTL